MPYTISGQTLNASGVLTFEELTTVPGATLQTQGTGGNGLRRYLKLPSPMVIYVPVGAELRLDKPDRETLEVMAPGMDPALSILGTLTLGQAGVQGLALVALTAPTGTARNPWGPPVIGCWGSSTFNWRSGILQLQGCVSIFGGGQIDADAYVQGMQSYSGATRDDGGAGRPFFNFENGNTVVVRGLTNEQCPVLFRGAGQTYANLVGEFGSEVDGVNGAGANIDPKRLIAPAAGIFVAAQRGGYAQIVDSPVGAEHAAALYAAAGGAVPRLEIRRTVTVRAAGPSGAVVARTFARDTDRGSRSPRYASDMTYAGSTPHTAEYVTAVLAHAAHTNTRDYRWPTAGITVGVKAYGYLPGTVTVPATGTGAADVTASLLALPLPLTQAQAQALVVCSTLDDVLCAMMYASATDPALAESPALDQMLCALDGAVLDCGAYNVLLSASAQAVVALAGNTITVKCGASLPVGALAKSIKTTGTVSTAGVALQVGIVDANGDSYLSFDDIDSWIVYSDPARTVQIGAGAGSALFRFVYAPGVTYYLKCVAGSTEFAMVATPTGAGDTPVTLSTQALLTTLQAKVTEVKVDTADIKAATGLIKVTVL